MTNKHRRFRVLHVHTRADVGGSAWQTLSILKGLLADRDFEPLFACGEGHGFFPEVERYPVRCFHVKHLQNPVHPVYDFMAFVELFRIIRKEKIDIVHTHNSKAGILGRWAAWLAGVPSVFHTLHGNVLVLANPVSRFFYLVVERLTSRITHELIVVSKALRDLASRAYKFPPEHIHLVYSGIDLKKFNRSNLPIPSFRDELNLPANAILVGCVARMEEGKGHFTLLKAAAQVLSVRKNVLFLLVGGGSLEPDIRKWINARGLDKHFRLSGFLIDVERATAAMDIAVLPSIYEGLGRVFLEAMAMGVPVIGTRVGGIPDIIDDEKNGFLIEVDDDAALAERILRMAGNSELRKSMGKSALQKISDVFSERKVVNQTIYLYRQTLDDSKP